MKSDLANAVKGVSLPAQDDVFLCTHLLAGQHEIDELATLIEAMQLRKQEAQAIFEAIQKALVEHHPHGKNLVIGKKLLTVGKYGVTLADTEVLA